MPIVVRVVSDADYSKWVGERKPAARAAAAPEAQQVAAAAAKPAAKDDGKPLPVAELVSRGEKIYASTCVACHQAMLRWSQRLKRLATPVECWCCLALAWAI